jgi:hypothetical protein
MAINEMTNHVVSVDELFPIREVVKATGLKKRCIQRWAERLRYKKVGGIYLLNVAQIDEIKRTARRHPGRPPEKA